MSKMKQPFMTALFTASSHHPFVIPEKYTEDFPEGNLPIHKCIRYTDMAIGKFFETARKQPWFENTIFVMTSDHTNQSDHAEYQTDLGGFCSPIIIYDPSASGGMQDKIAQQIDILPTVLGLLGYPRNDLGHPREYIAFGIDVLNTPAEDTWAVNYLNGIYQYVKYGYVLQFDGTDAKAVYSLEDRLMKNNLKGKIKEQAQMELELKAIIQQYMERMSQNRLMP
jgi:phosphoglycerol transferase MdoB-like AlkP superfamily enzyme